MSDIIFSEQLPKANEWEKLNKRHDVFQELWFLLRKKKHWKYIPVVVMGTGWIGDHKGETDVSNITQRRKLHFLCSLR